jgi:four helix bundle protein
MFASKLADSDGEGAETQVHLDFARDCGYMSHESHSRLIGEYERLGKMIGVMMADPSQFMPQ